MLQNNNINEGVILRILLVPVVQQNPAVGVTMMINKGVLSIPLVLQQDRAVGVAMMP
jgi:hypothetical protein